ncbi:hypothetical protein ACFX2I_022412 [Malus domestica]|uniref:Dirigent protein n=1 Tax=Malus domestica TaxID=3750 RepID=A0A498HR63_MALDO|nr:hypothetical protein DVH24_018698 [Malus domestica]
MHAAILLVATVEPAAVVSEPVLEIYMHDNLRGNSPMARPIIGLLGNIYSGQVPFAKSIGLLPPNDRVAIPNANSAISTVNGANGLPLRTGLFGTSFTGDPNG